MHTWNSLTVLNDPLGIGHGVLRRVKALDFTFMYSCSDEGLRHTCDVLTFLPDLSIYVVGTTLKKYWKMVKAIGSSGYQISGDMSENDGTHERLRSCTSYPAAAR